MDLIDEENVALFQIGQQRSEVAGLGDHRARGSAEVDAEFACDDVRQRRLAETRRTDEEHMVERLFAAARRINEDLEVCARLCLADKLRQQLRAQRRIGCVVGPHFWSDDAAHRASSFRPSRMSCSAVAASPATRAALATAALACTCA